MKDYRVLLRMTAPVPITVLYYIIEKHWKKEVQ